MHLVPALMAAALTCVPLPVAALASELELEEVVVTAQRREEPLQKVPVSASVLSADQLERAQIVNVDTLQYAVPNLTNSPINVSRTALTLNMRGQYSRDNAVTVDPTVGLYLDDVYIGRLVGANLGTVDLERIEVLRGPQGTLFGRNTIGGAINLISRRPDRQFAGRWRATAGNYGRTELDGALNLPLANGLHALRLTGALSERAGFGQTAQGEPLDDEHARFARLQYRSSPRPGWDLNLSLDYSRIKSGAERRTLLEVTAAAAMLPARFGNPNDNLTAYVDPYAQWIPADVTGPVRTRVWGAATVLSAALGQWNFKSISSYRTMDSSALNADHDATPYDLAVGRYRFDDQRQISQELQAFGVALENRLEWIGGLHYFHEHGSFRQRARLYVPVNNNWNESMPWGEAVNRATGLYGQASYSLSDRWKLTGGARHNREGRQLTSHNAVVTGGVETCRLSTVIRDDPTQCRATLPERTFTYVPWTAGLQFQRDHDSLYYLKLSRGVRSGGYNIRGVSLLDLTTFDPEQVNTWEAGSKTSWMKNRLRLNLALYRSSFDDIQVDQVEPTPIGVPGVSVIRNGGQASIQGGELELTALLRRVRIAMNWGVTRAVFTRLDPQIQEITLDSHFLQTPRNTAWLSVDAPVRASFGDILLHADYGWHDAVWFDYPPETTARQAAFGLLNVRLTARFVRPAIELSLWVRNLRDLRYILRAYDGNTIDTAIPGDPRTVGITFTHRFERAPR